MVGRGWEVTLDQIALCVGKVAHQEQMGTVLPGRTTFALGKWITRCLRSAVRGNWERTGAKLEEEPRKVILFGWKDGETSRILSPADRDHHRSSKLTMLPWIHSSTFEALKGGAWPTAQRFAAAAARRSACSLPSTRSWPGIHRNLIEIGNRERRLATSSRISVVRWRRARAS